MISVLIIDDHEVVGHGVKSLIEKDTEISVDILSFNNDLTKTLSERKHDVYLVDLQMPDTNGIEITTSILHKYPEANVIIYTGYDIKSLFNKLVDCGVSGMVSKSATNRTLVNAIKSVVQGDVVIPLELFQQLRMQNGRNLSGEYRSVLTDKERDILLEVEKGKTNREISESLFTSQRTVEYSLSTIFRKLDARSRIEAVKRAKECGIL
ncbi:response regulator transcription factor [Heyndrickxia sporothermodurans]|uniref:response regulator transcription factor n=1 Tax=Heyndrickxia sporothermodurans TaxID=46224 RepID=UPI002E1BA321|nr:response regulator transcription factor [Heyndrickxia sporothermodurans]MED3698161.1 response regulator transcription factor [Heyndrickxia sporothermodurans]